MRLDMVTTITPSRWQYLFTIWGRYRLSKKGRHPLWNLVACVWVGISVLALVAVDCGKLLVTPNAASVMGLTWCEQIPCYQNFMPGRTRWTPQLAEFNRQLQAEPDPYHLSLWPSADGKFLDTLVIPLRTSAHVTAGDIVHLYGVPCRVDITVAWKWSSATLQYAQLEAQIAIDRQHLYPDSRVMYVTLHTAPSSLSPRLSKSCIPVTSSPLVTDEWQGFTSIQHYLTTP